LEQVGKNAICCYNFTISDGSKEIAGEKEMGLSTVTHQLETEHSKSMPVYVATPTDGGPYPALLVIHEAFGLNNHIKDLTRRLASEGYVAAAPDLFFREPTNTLSYNQLPEARELMARMVDDVIVRDLQNVLNHLHNLSSVNENKIGIIGWCWGGRIAFLAACKIPELKAVALYYAGRIVQKPTTNSPVPPIDMAEGIQCPILGIFGAEDQNPSVSDVNQIEAKLKEVGKNYAFKIYPAAGHGFFCDERPSFRKEAADDAWIRTLNFFTAHLKN
jgi:carboxymethylenebutenolidase